MLRYLKCLQNKDLALDHSMIPLGSCTMKLNADQRDDPGHLAGIRRHPPLRPARPGAGLPGNDRAAWNGLAQGRSPASTPSACSRTPARRANTPVWSRSARYHASRGEDHRNVCLIPKSAHGTNPATAQMCGMQVVVVDCDDHGNVDAGRPRSQGRSACGQAGLPDGHLPFDPRRVRGSRQRHLRHRSSRTAARSTWTAPTSTPRSA